MFMQITFRMKLCCILTSIRTKLSRRAFCLNDPSTYRFKGQRSLLREKKVPSKKVPSTPRRKKKAGRYIIKIRGTRTQTRWNTFVKHGVLKGIVSLL